MARSSHRWVSKAMSARTVEHVPVMLAPALSRLDVRPAGRYLDLTFGRGGYARAILERLKLEGPQDAESLAKALGVSAMAVRQHLYSLQEEGLLDSREEARKIGRPAKLWGLTAAADKFFPDAHADLSLDLLAALRQAFGEAGVEKLMETRTAAQLVDYGKSVKAGLSLRKKVEALAARRSKEGYMAEMKEVGRGHYRLIENHCPVCAFASACQGLCAKELWLFQELLGPDVSVERGDHILSGARRCAYDIRLKG